jgi:hypothetical protein
MLVSNKVTSFQQQQQLCHNTRVMSLSIVHQLNNLSSGGSTARKHCTKRLCFTTMRYASKAVALTAVTPRLTIALDNGVFTPRDAKCRLCCMQRRVPACRALQILKKKRKKKREKKDVDNGDQQ